MIVVGAGVRLGCTIDLARASSHSRDVLRQFVERGPLALLPAAFGAWYDSFEASKPEVAGGIGVVNIRGPLMHHSGWWFDSYDAITKRVTDALDAKPRALVLKIDSPGGTVSGLFETATAIRELAAARKVPLYAYVDGQACSAAYALACAADAIATPPSGQLGSIGVIDTLYDVTGANEKAGVRVVLVASGKRKTDGDPNAAITEETIEASRAAVDELAMMFFEDVAARRGLKVGAIQALEAGVFLGVEAVSRRLADQVMTFPELLAQVASDTTKERAGSMAKASKSYEDAVANLRTVAEGDDEEEAKKAKRMLAALEDEGDDEDEEDDEEEAAAKRALPLALKRIDALEAKLAARDASDLEAMVERDVAAGKIATADRAEYLELARTNAALYARLTKHARAVPVGRASDPREARKAAAEGEGAIDVGALSEVDAVLVQSLRASGLPEKRIKAALARRGAEV